MIGIMARRSAVRSLFREHGALPVIAADRLWRPLNSNGSAMRFIYALLLLALGGCVPYPIYKTL